jgi:hypothetical protein
MRLRRFLERIDHHMERGNELMELNREALQRNNEAFDCNNEAFDRNTEAFERNVAAFDDFQSSYATSCGATRRSLRKTRGSGLMDAEMRDLRDERRAQVRGLFAAIDRLEGGGAGATG